MRSLIKYLVLLILANIHINVNCMDLGYDVAKDLSVACTKALLSKYPASIDGIRFNEKLSENIIEGVPCNYCGSAIIDNSSGKIFYLHSNIEPAIQAHAIIDSIAVFNSTDTKSIKIRLKDLYAQYAKILGCDAMFDCLPEMLDLVRKGDSEQVMLLALKNATTRKAFFDGIDPKSTDIELIIYSTRICCQHCNFMLGGFLKEIISVVPVRRIRFFLFF